MPEQYDVIIRGGTVYDGSGAPGAEADLGIRGDRIVTIGAIPEDATAEEVVDASGLAVTPGFIDVHAHDDTLVLVEPDVAGKVMQGVTTVINGNCGAGVVPARYSRRFGEVAGASIPEWESYAGYLEAIAQQPPSQNVATLVGFGTMRAGALGGGKVERPATADEAARMQAWLREALEAGAVGMSTGLIYEPDRYATTDEIAEVAKPLAEFGALYASHVRGEGATLLEAHAEAMEIGRRVGVPVQISHHKASGRGNWGRVSDSIAQIEEARARGEDVTADQYPYTAGSTRLFALVQNGRVGADGPDAIAGADILLASVPQHPEWEGKSVADLADEWDIPDEQAAQRIIEDGGSGTIVVQFAMDEADVRTILAHPTTMIGTDGLGFGSRPHPRHYGTYPRILQKYVREEGVITFEDAIWKMTGFPATKFDLPGRGFIREGTIADVVVVNPHTVTEVSTYEDPRRTPIGIPWVFVNGEAVVRLGQHTRRRAGRPVRRGVDA
ncbi:MAG: amidohydrolase family protein [Dehalococcoidia bacterium]